MFTLGRLTAGNIHMCFSSLSGYRPFTTPTPYPMKLTFRYIFYDELYSGVVLFSLIFRVRVRVRVRIRDR